MACRVFQAGAGLFLCPRVARSVSLSPNSQRYCFCGPNLLSAWRPHPFAWDLLFLLQISWFLLLVEIGFYSGAQAELELSAILLPQLSECWHEPPWLTVVIILFLRQDLTELLSLAFTSQFLGLSLLHI